MRFLFSYFILILAPTLLLAQEPELKPLPTPVVPKKIDLPLKNFVEKIPGDNGIKFEMIYIPAGEVLLGSPADEPGREKNEGPQVKVKIRAFWMAKVECTWDEFDEWWKNDAIMKADQMPQGHTKADAITRPTNPYVDELYDHGKEGFPAICMTHHAAMMYCHYLRAKTGKGYRLPTEAEWEYAARAGSKGKFCCPDSEIGDYAWYKANSPDDDHEKGTTHKCGMKKANAFGLHDMHGNVWEWCLDHYQEDTFSKIEKNKLFESPFIKTTDKKYSHIVKGGSWIDTADKLRIASKRGSDKTWMKDDPQLPQSIWWLTKKDTIGFRVVLPVEEYPELVDLKPMVLKRPD